MRGRTQAVLAFIIAYAVVVILVSPAVASPLSTAPSRHTVHPPQVIVQFVALLLTTATMNLNPIYRVILAPPAHMGVSGSDLVDLNTARLC